MNYWNDRVDNKDNDEAKLLEKFYDYLKIHKDVQEEHLVKSVKKENRKKYIALAITEGTILVGLSIAFVFLVFN